ncbi:hypothetical protein CBR_g55416 [Chara braunii]|uniref:Uncharacterized protein n=1 Tax=Chara braunii TaxID=69332 RepID=A0A388K808_CHABU|nr:hypothetical protein CBR_g55416 [Chara braunii]|eukprot:GBG66073.1 hypothetical protein CBR_g55416 [Chara braunii]
MVYSISPGMKKRLARYSLIETGESIVGYVVLAFLTLDLGAFASYMSGKVMGTCVALSFVAAFSKVIAFMENSYFNGRSCAQVASITPHRFQLGRVSILTDDFQVTLTFHDVQVAVRLLAMVAQVGLGIVLRLSVSDIEDMMSNDAEWAERRLQEYTTAVDAQANRDSCGLQGYWFYSMKELLRIVRAELADLPNAGSGCTDENAQLQEGQENLKMALTSLLELSRKRDLHLNCLFTCKSGEMARHMQDLPLLSRCSNDVDAGRDFARAEGYVVMLQVLECAPPNAGEVEMAASILAGFGWGLSVLPWQNDRDVEDKDFVLKMLCDDDFLYCTRELLDELLKLLPCLPPKTGASGPACSRQDNPSLQEAAISAICSFAHAASDIHAQAEHRERCEKDARTANPQCDTSDCTITLCNAFTTRCPTGWLLEKEMPDFRRADNTWAKAVTSVLDNQPAVDLLLSCARNELNVSRRVVGDAIRTLSSLWSCKAIHWHRFDKRMPKDFPPPLADVSTLPNHDEIREKLASLVLESAADRSSVSPLAKLHLVQILISQNIRDEQLDVDIADVLLDCLRYWRRAVGNHLLEYFACEVMETLFDLFETSENKVTILGRIERSPGGVDCLKLMTSTVLAPIRAVRLEHNNFDSLLSDYLQKDKVNDWCGDWTEDYVTDCAGTAAGLLALFLSVPGGPDFITPANIEFLGAAVEHATGCEGQAPISQPLVETVLGSLRRALGWLCIPLGHPTWQPLGDRHADIHEPPSLWLKQLVIDVLTVVHRRNVVRLMCEVVRRNPGIPLQNLSPVLAKLREMPPLRLSTPRGLQAFDMNCERERKAEIEKIP